MVRWISEAGSCAVQRCFAATIRFRRCAEGAGEIRGFSRELPKELPYLRAEGSRRAEDSWAVPLKGLPRGVDHAVIDCDLHNEVPSPTALFPYLAPHWIEHIQNTLFKGPIDTYYPQNAPVTARKVRPADGSRRRSASGGPAAGRGLRGCAPWSPGSAACLR